MSKKSSEKDKGKDERDLEDETDEEEEDEDDEDEVEAAPAKPVDRSRRAHDQRKRSQHHDDQEASGQAEEPEDPYWWTPHAVLGALVLIGVLGFFGLFNKTPLARLAAPVAPAPAEEHHPTTTEAAAPAPRPAPQPPRPGAEAQPREMFGAKHLLVMYKGGRRAPPNVERTKDEAKARATEAMKKAKADPSKFADLVKEYSDEPGAGARGGDLGKFPKGAMVPEFQAGLEKIKVGEVSDLVETPFGFHVILRTQ
ncbi:MAG: peptidyl-prolyl cis-trans isomerase [Polyangiaceae bacterium]|nr:peptidyl-prolyl cis-trans isomerase [Polyangiaceae bacterium]